MNGEVNEQEKIQGKRQKSSLITALIIAIVVLAFVLILLLIVLFSGGREDTERDVAENTSEGKEIRETTEMKSGEDNTGADAGYGAAKLTVVGANEAGGLEGASVLLLDADGETVATAETDSAGNAEFSEVPVGEYTVVCEADGYNARETELAVVISQGNAEDESSGAGDPEEDSDGSPARQIIALAPQIVGDDACVLLVWAGGHDLDLCAFHSELKEYVNIGHPVDSAGNMILYADHGADAPYELLYIHDISDAVAKSIYVTEAAKARTGETSSMEADGVWIFVYDASGLVFSAKADSGEEAALWRPCYYYMSNVYEEQEYISATRDEAYAWLSFEEEDAYSPEAMTVTAATPGDDGWKQAYLNALNEWVSYNGGNTEIIGGEFGYVDGDEIPEMFVSYSPAWGLVCTYHNGIVESEYPSGLGVGIGYIPKSGKYMEYTLAQRGQEYTLCTINGSGITYSKDGGLFVDIYEPTGYSEIEWGGTEYPSEEAFHAAVNRDYDSSGEITVAFEMTYDQMVAYLTVSTESAASATSATTTASAGNGWKAAYLEVVRNGNFDQNADIKHVVGLIYLNNDDIPELIMREEGIAFHLYTYVNGAAVRLQTEDYLWLQSVVTRSGMFMMDVDGSFPVIVYSFDGSKTKEIGRATQYAGDYSEDGDDRNWAYEAYGRSVTEAEFNSYFGALQNSSYHYAQEFMSYEEALAYLSGTN